MKAKFLALAALVLGLASCQTDTINGVKVDANGEAPVTIQVALPEATRAAGADSALGAIGNVDLENAYDIRYILGVYDEGDELAKRIEKFEDKSTSTTFDLRLVPGRHYRFVVWADFVAEDTEGALHYDASDLKDIKLVKSMAQNMPMDESRDAYTGVFYTADNGGNVFSSQTEVNMTLTRPFAKLRVVANDMKELYSDLVSATVTYSVPLYTSFNALTAKPEDLESNVVKNVDFLTMVYTNEANPRLNGEQTLYADYLFGAEGNKVHFTLDVVDGVTAIPTINFNTNIPVERNHLTTIYGPILTDPNNVTVTIDARFEQPDHIVDIWDGKSKTEPAIEINEEGEPVAVIDSASDLAWLADSVNGLTASTFSTRAGDEPVHFVLNADIDLDNQPWTPIGFNPNEEAGNENYFTGTFDGNGHEIRNLYIDVKDKGGVGLFGAVNNATIKNLTLRNVFVKAVESENDPANSSGAEGKTNYIVGGHIGAVAGYDAAPYGTGSVKFENVHVAGLIKIEAETRAAQGQRVGGIIGGRGYSKITFNNVSVIGEEGSYIKGYCSTAGVIGQGQGVSTFNGVTTNIPVYAVTFGAGGISGIACNGSTFTNCKSEGNVTLDASETQLSSYSANYPFRVGGIAGCWSDSKTGVLTLTNCSYEGNLISIDKDGNSPKAFDYAGYVGRGYALKNCAGSKVIIDGVEYVQAFDDVYGVYTVNGVYQVDDAADLKAIAAKVNAGDTFVGKTVKLTADIDLKNENWTPIGYWTTFNGTFDGNNHTISNLKHHGTEEDCYVGLFGYTENATIKNLTINNVDLKLVANSSWAGGHMGALVGNIEGETVIENITVTGDVKIDGNVEMAGAGRIGGVVGGNVAKVSFKDVVVNANKGSFVQGNSSIGGIAGQLQGETTFVKCSSNIDVTAQQFYAGGIIGLAYRITSFENCSASGNISVLAGRSGNNNDLYRVGGIAGGWDEDDNGEYILPLVNCSTTCVLTGKSADGRTATAFDCGGFVGRGYGAKVGAMVSVNGTVYEYAGEGVYKIGDSYVVNTGDALVAALAQKYNVTFGKDLKIDPANMSNAYGKTGVLVYEGQTIDGAGYKLDVQGAGGTWDSGICTSGGLIKNLWVTGSFRGVFVKGATHVEKVVLENVRIEGTTYTISIDQASGQGLEATNSIFRGWTSYAATIGNVKFDGCTFGAGNGYNFSRPYAPTEYVNCVFEAGHAIDPRAAVTFENCTFNGVALTAENLSTLVTSNIANASVK